MHSSTHQRLRAHSYRCAVTRLVRAAALLVLYIAAVLFRCRSRSCPACRTTSTPPRANDRDDDNAWLAGSMAAAFSRANKATAESAILMVSGGGGLGAWSAVLNGCSGLYLLFVVGGGAGLHRYFAHSAFRTSH